MTDTLQDLQDQIDAMQVSLNALKVACEANCSEYQELVQWGSMVIGRLQTYLQSSPPVPPGGPVSD